MTKQEHERVELYEDCDDLARRLDGAAKRIYKLGTANGAIMKRMDAELRRLRIAHLRRMLSSLPGAVERMKWCSATTEAEYERKKWRRRDQFTRFGKAIDAEITRLTQPR